MGAKCTKGDKGDPMQSTDITQDQFERIRGMKGVLGEPGNGITSIVQNTDDTLTIFYGNENRSFRTPPLKGIKGDKGDKGDLPLLNTDFDGHQITFKDGNKILKSIDTTINLQPVEDTEQSNSLFKNKFQFCNTQGKCGDPFEIPVYMPVMASDNKSLKDIQSFKLCLNGQEGSNDCVIKETSGLDGVSWQPRMTNSGDNIYMEFCPHDSTGTRIREVSCKMFPEIDLRGPQGPMTTINSGNESSIANSVASTLINNTNKTFYDKLNASLASELSKRDATINRLSSQIFTTYENDLKDRVTDYLLKNDTFMTTVSDGVFRNSSFADTLKGAVSRSSKDLAPQVAGILSGSSGNQDSISKNAEASFQAKMKNVIGNPIQCDANRMCNLQEGGSLGFISSAGQENTIRPDNSRTLEMNVNTKVSRNGLTTNSFGVSERAYVSEKLFVGGESRTPESELNNMRNSSLRVYGGTDILGNVNVYANTLDPSSVVMSVDQSGSSLSLFGNVSLATISDRFMSLNKADLLLRDASNANVGGIQYNSTFDGPVISGRSGGALGVIENNVFEDVLRWDNQKNVYTRSNIEVGNNLIGNNQNTGVGHISGNQLNIQAEKDIKLMPTTRMVVGREWGGSGVLDVENDIVLSSGSRICINGKCLTEDDLKRIKGDPKMFKIKRIRRSWNETTIDLQESSDNWQLAVVTSVTTDSLGDFDERGTSTSILYWYCYLDGKSWKLRVDIKSHINNESMHLWVLFMKDKWVSTPSSWGSF